MAKTNSKLFWLWFRRFQILIWSGVLLIILFFLGVNEGLLGEMPDLDAIQNPRNDVSTTVFSADGEVLGSYYNENRIEIGYSDLSPYLIKCLVATEDKRFFEHSGIDMKGLFGAVIRPLFTGNDRGGASTITQQLAKNLFHQNFTHANRIERAKQKFKEWVLAAKIERMFSKDEIITLYFNTVGFGYNSYGIKTAAFTYFGKTPREVKPDEAALLVGLLNAPGRFNPIRHKDKAKDRRDLVLRRLEDYGTITKKTSDSLQAKPIKLNFHNPDYREGIATYFREYLRQELKNWCAKNKKANGEKWDIYTDGLKVYTTIDSRMQKYAEEASKEHLTHLQKNFFKEWRGKDPWKFGDRAKPELLEKMMKQSARYLDLKSQKKSDQEINKIFATKVPMTIFAYQGDEGTQEKDTVLSPLDSLRYYLQIIQCGVMVMDAQNGEIKAWVGGPNLKYFQLDHCKKSTKRQVGSTMKPLQYAAAIERGFEPCRGITYQAPSCGDGGWNPAGTNHWKEGDVVPMQEGLWYSDNRMTANIMCELGPEALVEMARKLQIESDLDPVPSLCLGVSDISLFEMMGAYSAFANLGTYSQPFFIKKITDKNGSVLATFGATRKEALTENVAYTTTEMMKGVLEVGTAKKLKPNYGLKGVTLAGKTGTTQNNADAWYMSISPELVVGAWVGFEQPSVHFATTASGQGAEAALPIVGNILRKSYNDHSLKLKRGSFPMPSDSNTVVNFDCR